MPSFRQAKIAALFLFTFLFFSFITYFSSDTKKHRSHTHTHSHSHKHTSDSHISNGSKISLSSSSLLVPRRLVSNSYHKAGIELSGKTLEALAKCLGQRFQVVKSNDVNYLIRSPLTTPPFVFALEGIRYWPEVVDREMERNLSRPLQSSSPSSHTHPVYYFHYVRRPLDVIFSGFFFHLRATESWLLRPTTYCRGYSLDYEGIDRLSHFDVRSLHDTVHKLDALCANISAPYARLLPASLSTYQNLLRATLLPTDFAYDEAPPNSLSSHSPLHTGLWLETYRTIPILFQMYLNLYNQPPRTLLHYTESGAHIQSEGWTKAYVDKILQFAEVPESHRAPCTERIKSRLRKGNEDHVTNYDVLSEQRRKELEQRLLNEPTFGDILRKLEYLVENKRV